MMATHRRVTMRWISYLAFAAGLFAAGAAGASSPEAGRLIAQRECGGCHAVGDTGEGLLDDAPRFTDLRKRIDRDALAILLIDRLLVGHPRMPRLNLDPDETANLLTYWESLPAAQRISGPKRR
jgi:cytochrome c